MGYGFLRKSTGANRRKRFSTKTCRKLVLFSQESPKISGNFREFTGECSLGMTQDYGLLPAAQRSVLWLCSQLPAADYLLLPAAQRSVQLPSLFTTITEVFRELSYRYFRMYPKEITNMTEVFAELSYSTEISEDFQKPIIYWNPGLQLHATSCPTKALSSSPEPVSIVPAASSPEPVLLLFKGPGYVTNCSLTSNTLETLTSIPQLTYLYYLNSLSSWLVLSNSLLIMLHFTSTTRQLWLWLIIYDWLHFTIESLIMMIDVIQFTSTTRRRGRHPGLQGYSRLEIFGD